MTSPGSWNSAAALPIVHTPRNRTQKIRQFKFKLLNLILVFAVILQMFTLWQKNRKNITFYSIRLSFSFLNWSGSENIWQVIKNIKKRKLASKPRFCQVTVVPSIYMYFKCNSAAFNCLQYIPETRLFASYLKFKCTYNAGELCRNVMVEI